VVVGLALGFGVGGVGLKEGRCVGFRDGLPEGLGVVGGGGGGGGT